MRFLIVGGGSMGRRRMRCLLANDIQPEQIRLVDVRDDRRRQALELHEVESLPDLEAGLDWDPTAVIVSIPPRYHMDVCVAAARADKTFFCEVPLTLSMDRTDELTRLVEQNGVLAAPGIQAPFHPLVRQVRAWLDDPTFGTLLTIHQEWGQYLPDWHPYEDYRSFYAAKQHEGGAALDILGHEFAMLYWLLPDRLARVFCRGGRLSGLAIDGNDWWQLLAETNAGVRATLQYDLIQRSVTNVVRFVSERGTIELGLGGSVVERAHAHRYLAETGGWEQAPLPDDFEYETCYVDEIALLLRCLRGEAEWHVSLADALDVVRALEACLTSDERGVWVEV